MSCAAQAQSSFHITGPNILSASTLFAEDTEPFFCRESDHSADADSHRCHPGGLLLQGGQLLHTSSQNGKPLSVTGCCHLRRVRLRLSLINWCQTP